MVTINQKIEIRHLLKCIILIAVIFGALIVYQTLIIMVRQRSIVVTDIENSTFNLTTSDLICATSEVDQYILFTNSTQIVVTVESDSDCIGTVTLRSGKDINESIMVNKISNSKPQCIFTNLIADRRYRVSVEGIAHGTVRVSESISFWQALSLALNEIF